VILALEADEVAAAFAVSTSAALASRSRDCAAGSAPPAAARSSAVSADLALLAAAAQLATEARGADAASLSAEEQRGVSETSLGADDALVLATLRRVVLSEAQAAEAALGSSSVARRVGLARDVSERCVISATNFW